MVKKCLFVIKILAMIFIFWFLTYHTQLDFKLFYTLFQNPVLIVAILTICCLIILANAWRWYRLNSIQSIPLSLRKTILFAYIGFSFNTLLPGSIGGDLYRFYYIIKKIPEFKDKVALSIIIDRIIGLTALLLIIAFLLPWYVKIFNKQLIEGCLVLLSVIIVVAVGLFFLVKFSKSRIQNTVMDNTTLNKLAIRIKDMSHIACNYRKAKYIFMENIITSIIAQLLLLIGTLMLMHSMQLPYPSFLNCLLALIITQVVNLIPITPGGLGVGEVAFASILLLLDPHVIAPYATVFCALRMLMIIACIPGTCWGVYSLKKTF